MGVKAQRPSLPAPTESGTEDNGSPQMDDVATDLSKRSDLTSYSLPENGDAITIPISKRSKGDNTGSAASQTSLLIEYFEGGKSGDKSRPSVRVKVTPSGKRPKSGESVHITEVGNNKRVSHTRRISLAPKSTSKALVGSAVSQDDDVSALSQPLEVEVLQNPTDMSTNLSKSKAIPLGSDVSSMPGDSVLDRPIDFKEPDRSSRNDYSEIEESVETVKSPRRRRSRSLSRERLERRAAAKARELEQSPEDSSRRRVRKSKDRTSSKGYSEEEYSRSRRTSKSHSYRDSGDFRSGSDSSFLRPRDATSNVSALSKSSLANNPRLLQTVEDAIRRMILPEIDEIKRQQSVHQNASRSDRKVRESTSEPQIRSERRATRDLGDTEEPVRLRKSRRSSKDVVTEDRRSRRTSEGSKEVDSERRHKSREVRRSSKDSRVSEGLTTAALRSHDARSRERERRERRKGHSKSHSRSDSNAITDEEYYGKSKIPPMPLQSTLEDSDMTRESLLSAETTQSQTERPDSRPSRQTATPVIQETSRGAPADILHSQDRGASKTARELVTGAASPRSVPSRTSLKNERSEKNIRNKARDAALVGVGLSGAAAGLYYDRYRKEHARSRGLAPNASVDREVSPVQTEGSVRDSGAYGHKTYDHPPSRPATVSSIGPENDSIRDSGDFAIRTYDEKSTRPNTMSSAGDAERQLASRSIDSMQSTESTKYPLTQKRHAGVNLEKGTDILENPPLSREVHDRDLSDGQVYRDSMGIDEPRRYPEDYDSQRDSRALDTDEKRSLPKDNVDSPGLDKVFSGQNIQAIAANPQFVTNPVQAESETGSLLENSLADTPRSVDPAFAAQSFQAREAGNEGSGLRNVMMNEEANDSRTRWNMLRENAQALSKESLQSKNGQQSRELQDDDGIQMSSSGLPLAHDPMPEIGHGIGDDSDSITDPSIRNKQSSIHEGPLGDERENRDHWPYEPTPPGKRGGWIEDEDEQYVSAGNAALMGAAAGLGIGGAAVAANATHGGTRELQNNGQRPYGGPDVGFDRSMARPLTPGRDEGYISAAQPRSQESFTPLSFSKPPPQLFGDRSAGYDRNSIGNDPFISQDKKARHLSNSSYGMPSGYYDAATGGGMNNIQNQDIVALMDHLTVRDGQRSARDTQIIHNLVKSAADARLNFQEVKQLIQFQSQANLRNQDKNTDKLLEKIRAGGPRPQILGSPRTPGSVDDIPTKKQNVFKRALKGLSSRSTNDVSRIEDMLVQLLGEIETLKAAQIQGERPPTDTPSAPATRGSVDTYDNVQTGPGSGYEPEGQAGTGSTPGNSGYFSQQSRNASQAPRLHSESYGYNRASNNRVSTVIEDSEEDRQVTPTQAQNHQMGAYTTPIRQSQDSNNLEMSPPTATSSDERNNRRSTFSYPRLSRWSKTTASSGGDYRGSMDSTGQRLRPESEASQSGEAIDVIPPVGSQWRMSEDDRLRSAESLAREDYAPSPDQEDEHLIEDGFEETIPREMLDDPKYKANRKSLILEHPQPRQGPTGRHRNHLENQAYAFDTDDRDSTPDQELFGSVPALARMPGGGFAGNRMSGMNHGNLSPLATRSDNSPRAYQPAPARPPKIRDDGPLIPPKVPLTQTDMQQSENRDVRGPRGSYSTTSSQMSEDDSFQEGDPEHSEADSAEYDFSATAFDRKRSPYMPGGPLAPIEERYSMEGDRSSIAYSLSQRSRRQSLDAANSNLGPGSGSHSRRESGTNQFGQPGAGAMLAQVEEESERERSMTPQLTARSAVGAEERGSEVRKLTGPREMPAPAGGLRGTVRRKPIYGEMES